MDPSQTSKQIARTLVEMFGRPALLNGEKEAHYDLVLLRFIEEFQPGSFAEEMLLVQFTACNWEIIRTERHKGLTIERRFRRELTFQAKRAKELAKTKDSRAEELANPPSVPPDREFELKLAVADTGSEITEMFEKVPAELDHAKALEAGIDYYTRLDKVLNDTMKRREQILDVLERVRFGLAGRLRTTANEIIQQSQEAASPPLAPNAGAVG